MHITDVVLLIAGIVFAALAVGLATFEFWAIANKTPGDTYSERTRVWFRTHTKRGAFVLIGVLGGTGSLGMFFLIWYSAHIIRADI